MSSEVNASGPQDSGRHVMVVDDEAPIVTLLNELLKMNGYRVSSFSTSKAALRSFTEAPGEYDLVITDQMMPAMTGTEMAREMLKLRPDLPVILCTGYSKHVDETSIYDLGIRGFFPKPVEVTALLDMVYNLLQETA